MRISSVIEERPIVSLRSHRFTRTKLPEPSEEEATRFRESRTAFPPGEVNVPLQGLADGQVVIGQKRLALAKTLGLKTPPYQAIEEASPEELNRWTAHENRGHRLTEGQLRQLALGLKPQLEAEAQARQAAGRRRGGKAGGRGRGRQSLEANVASTPVRRG